MRASTCFTGIVTRISNGRVNNFKQSSSTSHLQQKQRASGAWSCILRKILKRDNVMVANVVIDAAPTKNPRIWNKRNSLVKWTSESQTKSSNFDACLSREFFLCWRETTNFFEDKHLFLCGYKKTKAQRRNWHVQSFSVINAEDVVFRNSNVPDSLIPLFQHHSVWVNSRLFERLTGKELPVLHD